MSESKDGAILKAAALSAILILLFFIAAYYSVGDMTHIPGKLGILSRTQVMSLEADVWRLTMSLVFVGYVFFIPLVLGASEAMRGARSLGKVAFSAGLIGAAMQAYSQFMQATLVTRAADEMVHFPFKENHVERVKSAYLAQSVQWNVFYPFSTAFAADILAQSFIAVMFACLGYHWIRQKGIKTVTALLLFAEAIIQFYALVTYMAGMDGEPERASMYFGLILIFVLPLLAIVFFLESRSGNNEEQDREET